MAMFLSRPRRHRVMAQQMRPLSGAAGRLNGRAYDAARAAYAEPGDLAPRCSAFFVNASRLENRAASGQSHRRAERHDRLLLQRGHAEPVPPLHQRPVLSGNKTPLRACWQALNRDMRLLSQAPATRATVLPARRATVRREECVYLLQRCDNGLWTTFELALLHRPEDAPACQTMTRPGRAVSLP